MSGINLNSTNSAISSVVISKPSQDVNTLSAKKISTPALSHDKVSVSKVAIGIAATNIDLSPKSEVDKYVNELKPFSEIKRFSPKEKRQIFKILKQAKKVDKLPELASELNKSGELQKLYRKIKLPKKSGNGNFMFPVNLSNGGTAVLTQANFPNYSPSSSDDFADRSVKMKRILKRGNVSPEILNSLK